MSGKGHIASSTIIVADAVFFRTCLEKIEAPAFPLLGYIDRFNILLIFQDRPYFVRYLMLSIGLFLFYIGSLLPDIDNPDSLISKMLHLNIRIVHRGFFHSVWFASLFLIPGIFVRYAVPFSYMGLGILVHYIVDRPSPAGWVPLYPLGNYRIYENTVFTNKRHLSIYRTGDLSELAFIILLLVLSITALFLAYTYHLL